MNTRFWKLVFRLYTLPLHAGGTLNPILRPIISEPFAVKRSPQNPKPGKASTWASKQYRAPGEDPAGGRLGFLEISLN